MLTKTRLKISLFITFIFLWCSPGKAQFYQIFGPTDIVGCNYSPQTYNIETNAQIIATDWSVLPAGGAVVTGSIYTAVVQFFGPGVYTLVATSYPPPAGLMQFSDSLVIVVHGFTGLPSVEGCFVRNQQNNCYQVCAGSVSTISYQATQLQWDISGHESYTLINPFTVEVTWGSGGNGSVSLSADSCVVPLCFEILPLPTADFQTNPAFTNDTLSVCKYQEIQFDNLSFNGLSYTWHFGDGSESISFDATHTFTTEGYYTVTLDAESICTCSDSKQIVVEVLPAPAPTLDCVNTVCPESRQRYTATTNGCTQFDWSISSNGTIVNGGEPADDFIEIIWHDGPEGIINLSVSSCSVTYCSYANVFHVPILTPDGPVTGDIHVCSSEVTTYSVPYFPGTHFLWQVTTAGTILGGQNTNAVTVRWNDVSAVTNAQVKVDYDNCFLGCTGQDVLDINITPEIRLNGDTHVCQDGVATIDAAAGFVTPMPANVSWHIENEQGVIVSAVFGPSTSFTHTFSYPPGEYFWVATSSSAAYCNEDARHRISVTATPDVPLGIEGDHEICPGQPFGFTIQEAGNYATVWTITDGPLVTHDQGQSILHTFGLAPPYIIEAAHADLQYPQCISATVSITLSTASQLIISGDENVCAGSIETYSIPFINGSDYVWEIIPADYGEVKRSDLNVVDIFWSQSGSATIRLHTCGTTIDKNVIIHALPAFNVSGPLAACANEMVMLSTDLAALPHVWRNAGGAVVSTSSVAHLYPDTYSVELTDALGCSDKKSITINTYPTPNIYLTTTAFETYCSTVPGGVELVANTDGTDYAFTWFKDDIDAGVNGPIYTVTDFGAFSAQVVNQYGCKASSPKIEIKDCCIAADCPGIPGSFPGCTYLPYDFMLSKTGTECQSHHFDPGVIDLLPGETKWIIHSISEGIIATVVADELDFNFAHPGYYLMGIFSVRTGFPYSPGECGHAQIFQDTIRAVADFQNTGICAGEMIQFEDLTTFIPGEMIASWHWDFGDPTSGVQNESVDQDPVHIYDSNGDYIVVLTVTMASGCTTTKSIMIHISAGPALSPVLDGIFCEDEAYRLILPGEFFNIDWNFGDPPSGVLNHASSDTVFHTFDLPGNYVTTVAADDIFGCRSQEGLLLDIRANTLSGNITVDPSDIICFGDTVILTAPVVSAQWIWTTGDTTSQIAVTSTDNYSVLIEDFFHCTYSPPPQFITVLAKPNFIISGHEILGAGEYGPWQDTLRICAGTEFQLQAFSEGSIALHWSHGPTDDILEFTDEGGNIPGVGVHEFSVTGVDPVTGCVSDTAFYYVEIYALPNTPAVALISGSGCGFDDNTLQITNPQPGIEYVWSDGQKGTSIMVSASGSYSVVALNQNGCTAESLPLTIMPSAPVDQIPGGCHIECDPLTVCLPLIDNVVSWNIYQDGSLYLSGTTWPSDYLITTDGSYTIEVTTLNGCVATSDPLDISLYTGVGSITVLAYEDIDGDGIITSADVLLSGIPVQIESADGLQYGSTFTEAGGGFVFEDYPSGPYTASFDLTLLSSQWNVIIDSVQTQIATCGDSVVVSLLLRQNCTVTGPDVTIESCPGEVIMYGDSTWNDIGLYTIHLQSMLGCDSVFNVNVVQSDTIQIGVTVWVDVDENGILSPADTVISGITIVIDEGINHAPFIGLTDINGNVVEEFFPGHYIVSIDSTILPPGLLLLDGVAFVPDTFCGSVHFDFLLGPSCADAVVVQQQDLCAGDSLLIQGLWIHDAGIYSFLISPPGSPCDTTLDVHVTILPVPVISGVTDWDCIHHGSIELMVQGPYPFQYFWTPALQGDSIQTDLNDGSYAVSVVDANGCNVSDTFLIQGSPSLYFDLLPQYEVYTGDSVVIELNGDINAPGLSFQWNPSTFISCDTCSSTLAYPDSSVYLTIHITDADSCSYDLATFINVLFDTLTFDQVYVPNVFSPNDDGFNDRWTIYSRMDNTWVHSLVLFDRWGKMLFSKGEFLLNDFEGWDGISGGKKLNPGVFAYVAELTLGDGTKTRVKGDVTLVR